jgi:hypothetical protein
MRRSATASRMSSPNKVMTEATLESASRLLSCLTNSLTVCRVIWLSGVSPKAGRMWMRRWLR